MDNNFFTPLLKQYFDLVRISSKKLMSHGKENSSAALVGDFGTIILRIWGSEHAYMGKRKESDVYGELAFMNFCRLNGILVPKIFTSKGGNLFEKTSDGRYFAVMEFVEGESPQYFTPRMLIEVAQAMAKMHNLASSFKFPDSRSWPGTLIEMTNQRLERFDTLVFKDDNCNFVKSIAKDFTKWLMQVDLAKLPFGVIHGDIMWENMKFSGEKLNGIFDFDDCRESYFLEDITKTLLFDFESPGHCLFGEDGTNINEFIKAYNMVRKLSEYELNLLPLFFTSRFLYQVTSYYLKLGSATTEEKRVYLQKIDKICKRYKDNLEFFTYLSAK